MMTNVPVYSEEKSRKDVDDWYVDGSDDEKYNPLKSGRGVWEPSAEDILKLYEKLEKDKVLELKWKCPGRKPPPSETEVSRKNVDTEEKEKETSMEEEEKKQEQPTEFDFDDDEFGDITNPITPRRTPGAKTPKSQKKVATMDKVLKNIMIERKQAALQKEARKLAKSPRTPQSTQKSKSGTPPITPNTGQGQQVQTVTPLRPPAVSEAPPIRNLAISSASEMYSNVSDTIEVQTPSNISAKESTDKSEKNTEDGGS